MIFSLYKIVTNYLLSPFLYAIHSPYTSTKNLNIVLYDYTQDNPVFTSIIFYFYHNTLCMDLNASSIFESLVISLAPGRKILQSILFL